MHRLAAAIIFFTRLPLWRVCNPDKSCYEHVVPLWPVVGWVTGGVMTLVFWLTNMVFPVGISVALALVSRLLLTGALHEDGFADFCDGFGGGTSRQRTLEIMKDSHIGTYGVLGLVLYYLVLWQTLSSLFTIGVSPWWLLAIDVYAKYLSSTIIYFLPYARKEEEAKAKLIYAKTTRGEKLMSAVFGLLPFTVLLILPLMFSSVPFSLHILLLLLPLTLPVLLCALLFGMMKRRINGYTGDCCGATFLLAELVGYMGLLGVIYM